MHLTPFQLAAGLESALAALEAAGVPRENVVLGFTNTPRSSESDTLYETHVGATRDDDTALLLDIVARDIAEEAGRAAMALGRPGTCPACGSPRLAVRRERRDPRPGQRPGVYVSIFDDCLDCDYRAER